jgi:recombination protein RecA
LVDLAERTDVIVRKGAWYSYNGENIAQGRDNAMKYLEERPELMVDVEKQVREKLEIGSLSLPVSSGDEEEGDLD